MVVKRKKLKLEMYRQSITSLSLFFFSLNDVLVKQTILID